MINSRDEPVQACDKVDTGYAKSIRVHGRITTTGSLITILSYGPVQKRFCAQNSGHTIFWFSGFNLFIPPHHHRLFYLSDWIKEYWHPAV